VGGGRRGVGVTYRCETTANGKPLYNNLANW